MKQLLQSLTASELRELSNGFRAIVEVLTPNPDRFTTAIIDAVCESINYVADLKCEICVLSSDEM